MADKIVAEFKEKEFERLKDYALNQISQIECGLNIASMSRGIHAGKGVTVPSMDEIKKLFETLIELRFNMLTPEERRLLK